jgi:hypothetical protein
MKTIDISAKEWFDKVNGNSYWSVQVRIDFGLPTQKLVHVPFQYGYGTSYEWESFRQLNMDGILPDEATISPIEYCRTNGIQLNSYKRPNCLKRDVKAWGSN